MTDETTGTVMDSRDPSSREEAGPPADRLANYSVGRVLHRFSRGAVGSWRRGRAEWAAAGPANVFVQTIPARDVARMLFTPGRGDAWNTLSEPGVPGRPAALARMVAGQDDWCGTHLALAWEYRIWDDPDYPATWLATLLDDPEGEEFHLSLAAAVDFAIAVWESVAFLHEHGLLHLSLDPRSVLVTSTRTGRPRFLLYNAGIAVRDDGSAERHDAAADVRDATALVRRVLGRVDVAGLSARESELPLEDLEELEIAARAVAAAETGEALRGWRTIAAALAAAKSDGLRALLRDEIYARFPRPAPPPPRFVGIRTEPRPVVAVDRGAGRESSDRFEVRVIGADLTSSTRLALELVETPYAGPDVNRRRLALLRKPDRVDLPFVLYRESPRLVPGRYRLLALAAEDGGDDTDTGLSLDVALPEAGPYFQAVVPDRIEDCSRPLPVRIEGKRLRRAGTLRVGPVSAGPARRVDLEPVADAEDEWGRLERVVPALGAPGEYLLTSDGRSTGLRIAVDRIEPRFLAVEPAVVPNDAPFTVTVHGDFLLPGLEFALTGAEGPVELRSTPEGPEAVTLRGPAGLRIGEHEIHCDGAPTGLALRAECRVDSLVPRRLPASGGPREIVATGGLFDGDAAYALRDERTGVEVPLGPRGGSDERARFARPAELTRGRYELIAGGRRTGARLTVTRHSASVTAAIRLGAVTLLGLAVALVVLWIRAPRYGRLVTSSDVVWLYPGEGELLLVPPFAPVLEGRRMEPGRHYSLAAEGGSRPLLGLTPETAATTVPLSTVRFVPVRSVPADSPLGRAGPIALLVRGDGADGSDVLVTAGVPRFRRFEVGPALSLSDMDELPADGATEVRAFRAPAARPADATLRVTIGGTGLGLLGRGEVVVESGGRTAPVAVESAADGSATLVLAGADAPMDGTEIALSFRPGVGNPETVIARFRIHRSQGFRGVSLTADGEPRLRLDAYYGQTFHLAPEEPERAERLGFFLEATIEPQVVARIPTNVARAGEGLSLAPTDVPVLPRDPVQWTLSYRDGDAAPAETGCTLRLHPRPRWFGWTGGRPDRATVPVSADGVEGRPRLAVAHSSTVEALRLVTAAGASVDAPFTRQREGDTELLELDLDGRAGSLLPSGSTAETWSVQWRSGITGEWERGVGGDGVPLLLVAVDAARPEAHGDLVDEADRAFHIGRIADVRKLALRALQPEFEPVWSDPGIGGLGGATARDRLAFYLWFIRHYYDGVQRDPPGAIEPVTEAYAKTLRHLTELPWREFEGRAATTAPVDFARETPEEPADDWITRFATGYDAYLTISLRQGSLPAAAREERLAVAVRELRAAARTERILTPFLLAELESGLFGDRAAEAPDRLLARLRDPEFFLSPEQGPLRAFFAARALGQRAIRTGRGARAAAGAVVLAAEKLKETNPSRCALLCWNFVANRSLYPEGSPGRARLKACFESAAPSVAPAVARLLETRFR